jgi:hypothetical protein
LCRRHNVHLLAIGLAEVALVGLGPVGVVGGSAGHGEEMCMVQRRCVYYAPDTVQWRCEERGVVVVVVMVAAGARRQASIIIITDSSPLNAS